jgi:hypothetical protein
MYRIVHEIALHHTAEEGGDSVEPCYRPGSPVVPDSSERKRNWDGTRSEWSGWNDWEGNEALMERSGFIRLLMHVGSTDFKMFSRLSDTH